MERNANKERWIDEVMAGTDGITRAEPRAGLYERVMDGMGQPEAVKAIAIPVIRWVAAAILLLALNIGSAAYYKSRNGGGERVNDNPFAAAARAETTYSY